MEIRANPGEFDCANCKHDHHCDDDNQWPESVGPASYPIIQVKRNGFQFQSNTCLLPQITERTKHFFKLYKHYQQGHLLTAGGIYDQPNVYLTAMEILSDD